MPWKRQQFYRRWKTILPTWRWRLSDFKQKADAVRRDLEKTNREITSDLGAVGAQLVAEGSLDDGDEAMSRLLERELGITKRMGEIEETRDRIATIVARIDEIDNRSVEIDREIKTITQELEPTYQSIGEVAFTVFRENPFVDQEYADIFASLLENHEEVKDLESEISARENELEGKPFLERMVLRGKIVLLKNRKSSREGGQPRLFRQAGEAILQTGFVAAIDDPKLSDSVEPYKATMKSVRDREGELTDLAEERESLHAELTRLGAERRYQRKITELDQQLTVANNDRVANRAQIGSRYREILSGAPPKSLQAPLGRVEAAEGRRDALRERLARLEAAIAVERLEVELSDLKVRIDRKKADIERSKGELKELEAQSKSTLESKAEREKERGPIETLE